MIAEALRRKLLANAGIVAQLGRYEFSAPGATTTGAGDEAAIFTFAQPPKDSSGLAITIVERGGKPWNARSRQGTESAVELTVWGEKSARSESSLRALAAAVQVALDRADLTAELHDSGYEEWGCFADAPKSVIGAGGVPAYIVSVTVRLLKL